MAGSFSEISMGQAFSPSQDGFTLAELMVVIAVIGILSTIAIPNFIGRLPDYRLRNAVRALLSDMQQARLQAVKTNRNWAIVFDTANNQYLICSGQGDDKWSTTGDNLVYKTVNFSGYKAGVRFGNGSAVKTVTGSTAFGDHVTYGSDNPGHSDFNTMIFNSRGTSTAGYVYLENNRQASVYAVGSQSSGVVMSRRWDGSQWD